MELTLSGWVGEVLWQNSSKQQFKNYKRCKHLNKNLHALSEGHRKER